MNISKKKLAAVVLGTIILSWVFNLTAGRYLSAVVSTWPVLNHLGILNPQAPIVITNRETVRVEADGDAQAAIGNVKSKISLVLIKDSSGNVTVSGGAINASSDGVFVSVDDAFAKAGADYYVLLNDGRLSKISSLIQDPGTKLVFFKSDLTGVPTADLASSADLAVGEKAVFVVASPVNFSVKASVSSVSFSQNDIFGQTLLTDQPTLSFGAQAPSDLLTGEVVVNTSGGIVGLWDSKEIISSDTVKQAINIYFSGAQKITRPAFGFSYITITAVQSQIAVLPSGALVKSVDQKSPALASGLKINDIITKVDGAQISESNSLLEVLQKYKPGDSISLTVSRANTIITLQLIAGELK